MDERELAQHLLQVVDDAAYRNAARRVVRVRVAVGGRRHFDLERLSAVFDDAARGTVAEGASLVVDRLPVRRHCQNCGHDFEGSEADSPCPRCGHPRSQPVSGEEVRIVAIDVDELSA